MSLIACGISYHTAPLALREQIVFTSAEIIKPLQDLISCGAANEAAILSTCNRTELYGDIADPQQFAGWLAATRNVAINDLEPHLYIHRDQAAIRHIMRVASGLDSMILGEPQIAGQMKQAIAVAAQAGTIGANFKRLFRHIFAVTKQIRTDTAIGTSPISIAYTAVNLAKRIFADLSEVKVLLIGAGDVISLAARHLADQQVQQLIIANRSLANAQRLARQFNGAAVTLASIPLYLADADIIITATASSLPILGKGSIETALKTRKHRPILMIDLAMPRDIEPEVAALDDVYLYTLDDLAEVIQDNLVSRQKAAEQAEKIIDLQAEHYIRTVRSLDSVSTIRSYRNKIAALSQEELSKALKKLHNGAAPEQVLTEFARLISNKLMHSPTIQLRQAAYNGQLDILAFAKQLFDLKD